MKLLQKKVIKNLFVGIFVLAGLVFVRLVLAADFGEEAVNSGLDGSLATGDPRTLAGRIINIALGFLGTVAVGIIMWGGFTWMTASGDEDKILQAKKILRNGVIGLVIILSSWAIATFILTRLGGAISGDNSGCFDGQIQACGCGGQMVCSDGSWGACVGSNIQDCLNAPTSCDGGLAAGCQATDQICAAGYFCDDSCFCRTQGDSGDSCDGNLNNQKCDADNNRCSEYLTCNPDTCLCAGPPVITGLSPVGGFCNANPDKPCRQNSECGAGDTCNQLAANGASNNFLTIFGKNFGEYVEGASQVVFLGDNNPQAGVLPSVINPACVSFWTDKQIVIAIPTGVTTGAIQVINSESLTDSSGDNYGPRLADFVANKINRPGLCSLDPSVGVLSSEVNYQGVNLFSGQAYFGNYQSNVSGLYSSFDNPTGFSGVSLTPNIKEGESGSFVERVVAGYPQKSNYLKFIKDAEEGDGPYISSFTPLVGTAGQYITIKGSGFGGARGNNQVYFVSGSNKIEASYLFPAICANSVWSDKQIIIKVPEGLVNDYYQLEISLGAKTISSQNLNPNTFEYNQNTALKTSLCKIDPEQGSIDTPVTLWGEYFGQVGGDGLVRFSTNRDASGVIAKEETADVIKTTVPKEAVTGVVKVIKNNDWGNELNFAVGECTQDSECNNQVCCPKNTYREGRCMSSLAECFVNVPTSVFEWSFSTSFDATNKPVFDSCLGLSKYLGSCYQGASCPNSPGACSSPSTDYQGVVGSCDFSCQNVPGCTAATCIYNPDLNRCVLNVSSGVCDLAKETTFNIFGRELTTKQTCNSEGKWEITTAGSCPEGWVRQTNNRCVFESASCSLCGSDLTCESVSGSGRCVSEKICAGEAKCIDNPIVGEADKCVIAVEPSCECCCRIGKDAEDCCAGLTCAGECGSDLVNDSDTYGSCSGCALQGSTQAEWDAACNCSGHGAQFCAVTSTHPEGICSDCSKIGDQETCGDHSSVCCFDSNKTATTTDDFCRGVNGGAVINKTKGNPDYGYCGYYNCLTGDPNQCASNSPLKIGYFNKLETCVSGCAEGIGSDPCRAFDKNQASCSNEPGCCYDATTLNCLSGDEITGGANNGFCAYYNCQTPPGNPLLCDLTPTTVPGFSSTSTCATSCGNPPKGAGLGCLDSSVSSSCNFGLCSFPGFACLKDTGLGGAYPDCGTCCCEVGKEIDSCITAETPNLRCQPDKGSCTGANRGLCCGCTNDGDCGSINTIGCGLDGCCEARPQVVATLPEAGETNVCRNAAIKVSFNQTMDSRSFGNNFILFEERAYGDGVCPAGTFLATSEEAKLLASLQKQNIFIKVWKQARLQIDRLFGRVNETALATPPAENKLYCLVPGVTSAEESGQQTSLIFTPSKLLTPAAKYYVVIKGDVNLDSQSGLLSFSGIGLNERGFNDGNNIFINYNQIKFNNRTYPNSYSFQFTTLSDQGLGAGICAVDYVKTSPLSYLFKTTSNSLDEKDDNAEDRTFDKEADRDKVFTAAAYSSEGQLLHPVKGYNWNWSWSVLDENIAKINSVSNLADSQKLVVAQTGVTDGQTRARAMINMDNFRPAAGCGDNCNTYFLGDGESNLSDIYVFLCNNPWPAVQTNGEWFPWNDAANNCILGSANCENFNYKFYYCRDAGAAGTLDDLPAIISPGVVRGQGSTLICSSDKTACSSFGSACGQDQNGDGALDGLCFWNVLKESYFFRETILPGGEIIKATDTGKGGEIKLDWQSPASGVSGYKIYYLKGGRGTMLSKEVAASAACTVNGLNYSCSTTINNLIDGQAYVFKLTVISVNRTESALSNELTATPSNQTKPSAPAKPTVEVDPTVVKFSWVANPASEAVSFYRLYQGIKSGNYGASFDSGKGLTSITFNRSDFNQNLNYFVLTAVRADSRESDKSAEVMVDLR